MTERKIDAVDENEEPSEEMLRAGVEAFEWDERFEPLEAAIRRVYLAMKKARLKKLEKSHPK